MASLQDLIVRVGANIDDFVTPLHEASGHLDEFGEHVTSWGEKLAAAIPLAAFGAEAFEAGEKFEQASFTIQRATGATGEALEGLEKNFENLYATSGKSATEIASALSQISIATGLTGAALESLTQANLRFAKVTGTDVGQTLTANQRLFNEWGVTVEEQAAKLDVLFTASQHGLVPVQQLSQTMLSSGAILKSLGYSFNDAAALIENMGTKTGDLDRVMSTLNKGLATLQKEGIKDTSGAMQTLISALASGKMSTDDMTLATTIFGSRGINYLIDAAKAGAFSISDFTEKLNNSQGAVKQAADSTQSLGDKWTKFQHALEGALLPLGRPMVQALGDAAEGLKSITPYLESAAKWFSGLPPWIQDTAVAMAAVGVAGPIAGKGVTLVIEAIAGLKIPELIALLGNLAGGFTGVGTAAGTAAGVAGMGAITASIGEIAVVAAPAIAALLATKGQLDDLKESAKNFDEQLRAISIRDALKAGQSIEDLQKLGYTLDEIKSAVLKTGDAIKGVGSISTSTWNTVQKSVLPPIETLKQMGLTESDVASKLVGIQSGAINAFTAIKNGASIDQLKELGFDVGKIGTALDGLTPPVKKVNEALVDQITIVGSATAGHKDLAGAVGGAGDAAKKGTMTMAQLAAQIADSKDKTDYLAKAQAELKTSTSTLEQAYKATYIPAMLDVAVAQQNVQQALQNSVSAMEAEKSAQIALNDVMANDKGNKQAIIAATNALAAAQQVTKTSIQQLAEAHRDLATSERITKSATDELAASDTEYQKFLSGIHEPALKSYVAALQDVNVASAAAQDADERRTIAAKALSDLLKEEKPNQEAITAAVLNDKAAREAEAVALNALKQAKSDLLAVDKAQTESDKQLAADAETLAGLYKDHLSGSVGDLSSALQKLRDAKDGVTAASLKLADADANEAFLRLQAMSGTGSVPELNKAIQEAKTARANLTLELQRQGTAEQSLQRDFGVSKRAIDDVTSSTKTLTKAQQDSQAAFSALGIKSAESLKELADKAKAAYETIAASGTASANQQRDALIKALEAEKAAQIAAGSDITSEQERELDKLIAQQEAYNLKHHDLVQHWAQSWMDAIKQINQALTNDLSKAMSDLIFDIGKVGDDFKKLGQDIVNIVINHIIAEAIKPLLDSLDNVLGKLGSVFGGGVGGVFGGAGGGIVSSLPDTGISIANPVIGGVTGGAGDIIGGVTGGAGDVAGATGGLGGLLGSAGGLMGTLSGIGSVGSMVSGIIGNFQMMGMNKTLSLIEASTRYTWLTVGSGADAMIVHTKSIMLDLHAYVNNSWIHDAWMELLTNVGRMADAITGTADWANGVTSYTQGAPQTSTTDTNSTANATSALVDLNTAMRDSLHSMNDFAQSTFVLIRDEVLTRLQGIWDTLSTGAKVSVEVQPSAPKPDTPQLSPSDISQITKSMDNLTAAMKGGPFYLAFGTVLFNPQPIVDTILYLSSIVQTELDALRSITSAEIGAKLDARIMVAADMAVYAVNTGSQLVADAVKLTGQMLASALAGGLPQPAAAVPGVSVTVTGNVFHGAPTDAADEIAARVTERLRSFLR